MKVQMNIEEERVKVVAKNYAGIKANTIIDVEERYFNSDVKLYDAFIAGYLHAKSLEKQND